MATFTRAWNALGAWIEARGRPQPRCCFLASWVAERDLGSARGFEFDLGKCQRCGTPWMKVYCVASSAGDYEPISGAEAEKLKGLAPTDLRAAMRAWGDRLA
jgi:hypothetical protein